MSESERIFVAGHRGMVGAAIVRHLLARGRPVEQLVLRTRQDLDLTDQVAVRRFLAEERPHQVFLAAARVGGIHANHTFPAEFIYENLMIEANVIDSCFRAGVRRLLFLGSSCIYPRLAAQPMEEEALLTGPLESTNEPYAIAKIAGIKLCESYNRQYGGSHGVDYRSVMPSNLYGPGDSYHRENSHVIPALIRRFHDARTQGLASVTIWGTGSPRREFLHVDDLAAAAVHVMEIPKDEYATCTEPMRSHLNVGSGDEVTIAELARVVGKVVGFTGTIQFDPSKPDGTPRKLMNSTRIRRLGWQPRIPLAEGIRQAYEDFLRRSTSAEWKSK